MALRLICVAVIVAGTALRFDGLARRPLWYDEAATRLHLQGRSAAELRAAYDGRPLRAADLWPPRTTSAAAVVAGVAADEPQTGPGYFVLALGWLRIIGHDLAGDDLATLRALSAVASVIALLLVHRLALALFAVADVALAATALVAVSPLHLRYAQEARPYALWTALLVAAAVAVAVARARRRPSSWAWLGYAGAVGAALWVQPLTVLVLPALAALALSTDGTDSDRRSARSFSVATAVALVTWVPWAAVCWRGRGTIRLTTEWASAPRDVATLARGGFGVLTSVFYRPAGEGGLLGAGAESLAGSAIWVALGLVAVAVVAGGLWSVTRTVGTPTRRFVWLLALFPWAALVLADLVWGGRRSTVARYLVPTWIGAALAAACFVAEPGGSRRRSLLLLLLLALGIATALRTRSADVWWDTDAPRIRAIGAVAEVIAAEGAVVLTDASPLAVLELAHRLPAETVLRLGSDVANPPPDDWEHVALFAPSDALRAAVGAAIGPTRGVVPARGLPLWRVQSAADGAR